MARVWMKVKKTTFGLDIPHSLNIATAMMGFNELGAEIIPYRSLDDIYDDLDKEDIVLDYIQQCNEFFAKFDVHPYVEDYPEVLRPYLNRRIWTDTLQSFANDETKWSKGYFIKPKSQKIFTGKVIFSLQDLMTCSFASDNEEIIVSEALDVGAEWRCFILRDGILDIRPYGKKEDSWKYHYDPEVLSQMVEAFKTWDERPIACAIDICVTKDNRTCLVEVNDAYALGTYGLNPLSYAKFISARYSQLLHRKDEYHF